MGNLLRALRAAGILIAALSGLEIASGLYDRFILSPDLQVLRRVSAILGAANRVGEAEAAFVLVDQALVNAMAQGKLDMEKVASLQYAQGVLFAEESSRPVEDAQLVIESLLEERKLERPAAWASLDAMAMGIQAAFHQGKLIVRRRIRRAPSSDWMDTFRLQEVIRKERSGLFAEAAQGYEKLLRDYPAYAHDSLLKLRLAYLYQRLRDFDRAELLYRRILRETVDYQIYEAARQMERRVHPMLKGAKELEAWERHLTTLGGSSDRQNAAFKYGSLLIQWYNPEKGASIFHLGALVYPEGELSLPCLFKEAWCLRTVGRFEEALQAFHEVIHRDPEGLFGTAAYLQLAEAYKAKGDYSRILETYDQALVKSKQAPLLAATLVQAGATSLYDLKNPEKAKKYFQETTTRFPASPFSSAEAQLEQMKAVKEPSGVAAIPLPADLIAMGSPLMNWLEDSLPVFVELFAGRVAKHMASMAQQEITQRISQDDFQKIVAHRLQERFPGRISDVVAQIQPDGVALSSTMHLGLLSFPLVWKVAIDTTEESPQVVIHELRVGSFTVPGLIRTQLQLHVNEAVKRLSLPLRVTRCDFKNGYVLVSVKSTE